MKERTLSRANAIVIDEGIQSLKTMIVRIEELWSVKPARVEPPAGHIISNGDIPTLVDDICIALGVASLCLFARETLQRRANDDARRERAAFLDHRLSGIEIKVITDRQIRNRLMHIDEHISSELRAQPQAGCMVNLGISRRSMLTDPENYGVIFIRGYIMDEDCIVHLGTEMNLGDAHREARLVVDRLDQWQVGLERRPGGVLVWG